LLRNNYDFFARKITSPVKGKREETLDDLTGFEVFQRSMAGEEIVPGPSTGLQGVDPRRVNSNFLFDDEERSEVSSSDTSPPPTPPDTSMGYEAAMTKVGGEVSAGSKDNFSVEEEEVSSSEEVFLSDADAKDDADISKTGGQSGEAEKAEVEIEIEDETYAPPASSILDQLDPTTAAALKKLGHGPQGQTGDTKQMDDGPILPELTIEDFIFDDEDSEMNQKKNKEPEEKKKGGTPDSSTTGPQQPPLLTADSFVDSAPPEERRKERGKGHDDGTWKPVFPPADKLMSLLDGPAGGASCDSPEEKDEILARRISGKKRKLIAEILSRWWYVFPAWPPENFDYGPHLAARGLREVSPKNWETEEDVARDGTKRVRQRAHFPGTFIDSDQKAYDLRPARSAPAYQNLVRKSEGELFEYLNRACSNQALVLRGVEGGGAAPEQIEAAALEQIEPEIQIEEAAPAGRESKKAAAKKPRKWHGLFRYGFGFPGSYEPTGARARILTGQISHNSYGAIMFRSGLTCEWRLDIKYFFEHLNIFLNI